MHTETVCATDGVAARKDELQFDLGEGPAWTVVGSARSVLVTDLGTSQDGGRWPMFDHAVQDLPPRGLFLFPLLIGPTRVGVLTLYRTAPGPMPDVNVDTAADLARVIAPVLARQILTPAPVDLTGPADPLDRSEIYQATGVVMAQLDLTAETAFARIQAQAFSTGTTMALPPARC